MKFHLSLPTLSPASMTCLHTLTPCYIFSLPTLSLLFFPSLPLESLQFPPYSPSLSFFNSSFIFSLLTLAPFIFFSLLTFTLSPIPFPNLTPYSTFFPTTSLASPLHPLLCPSLPSLQPPFLPPFPHSLIHLFLPSLPLPSFPSLCSLLLYFPPYPSFIPLLPSCLLVSQTQNPLCLSFLLPSLSISLLSYCPFILSFFTTAMINNIDFSCY